MFNKEQKVLFALGTRPEAIKLAPLIIECQKEGLRVVIVSTGQHREMLDQVLEVFEIKPDYDLRIMGKVKNLSDMASQVLVGMHDIIAEEEPNVVVVQGDTTSAFVSGLAAFHCKVKIAHVEAGLRTNDKYSPFPEEMNRKLLTSIADYHFAPTQSAKQALLKEGVDEDSIYVTGNTVIDALKIISKKELPFVDKNLEKIDFTNKDIILLTTHRRENLDKGMQNIFDAVNKITEDNPNTEVVFPVHLNPIIRKHANNVLGDNMSVHLMSPLQYSDLVSVLNKCKLVLTDSGGIQEEAPALGKPVLVLRDTTERPEGVEAGTCRLIGLETKDIINNTNDLLNNAEAYNKMAKSVNPYGYGTASKKIVAVLNNDR
jgi:UDP-N-acetylglucosamine 2-epimerase (non-hydrolysing)